MNPIAGAASSTPATLEYSPRPPQVRRWFRRIVLIAFFIGTVFAIQHWWPVVWTHLRLRYYERQCAAYVAPADQVVYEEEPVAAANLMSTNAEYVQSRWDTYAPTKAKMSGPGAARVPACFNSFEILNGRSPILSGTGFFGPIVFLHERLAPTGEKRLVLVRLDVTSAFLWCHILNDPRANSGSNVWIQAIRSDAVPPLHPNPFATASEWPRTPPLARIYAGQVDPADPSHFTIRYQLWGQEDVIDGYLVNNDTVTLKARARPLPD